MAGSNFRTIGVDYLEGVKSLRNYIKNARGNNSSTRLYSAYNDGSVAAPIDGTGGTATGVGITTIGTTPLAGTRSLMIQKDAANRQGMGISTDFTIDRADLAKVLSIDFDYELNSGAISTGDLAVYIIDVTNSRVIQPSAFQVEGATLGAPPSRASMTFQTSADSVSYRLCFHVATTTAVAYNLELSNVSVSPQVIPLGTVVTSWTPYTLNVGATTTAPTFASKSIDKAYWRRVGDSMEISYQLRAVGSTSGSGTYLFPLPAGYVADTDKAAVGTDIVTNARNFASVYTVDAAKGATGIVKVYNTTNLSIAVQTDTNALTDINNTFFALGSASVQIAFTVSVPIAGWASSTVVSSSAETRVVAAKYAVSAGQSMPAAASTIINFNSKLDDTHTAVTTGSSWRFIAPVPGRYSFSGFIQMASQSYGAGNSVNVDLYKNDVDQQNRVGSFTVIAAATATPRFSFSDYVVLNAGEYFDLRLNHNEGTARSIETGTYFGHIAVNLVQGPSQIAASEVVAACYTRTTAATTTAGGALVMNSAVYDSHNSYNPTTGIFTAPISGRYVVSTAGMIATSATVSLVVGKNGAFYRNLHQALTTSITSGSVQIDLVAGDTCAVYTSTTGGIDYAAPSLTGGYQPSISIHRIGGVM